MRVSHKSVSITQTALHTLKTKDFARRNQAISRIAVDMRSGYLGPLPTVPPVHNSATTTTIVFTNLTFVKNRVIIVVLGCGHDVVAVHNGWDIVPMSTAIVSVVTFTMITTTVAAATAAAVVVTTIATLATITMAVASSAIPIGRRIVFSTLTVILWRLPSTAATMGRGGVYKFHILE